MTDCPECGYPMVWSDDREATWCAVFGSHAQRPRGEFAGLVRLCMEAPNNSRHAIRMRDQRMRLRVVA